jgi:hypothetical protein
VSDIYGTLEIARMLSDDRVRAAQNWRLARAARTAARAARKARSRRREFEPISVFWTTALRSYGDAVGV